MLFSELENDTLNQAVYMLFYELENDTLNQAESNEIKINENCIHAIRNYISYIYHMKIADVSASSS